MADRYAYEFHWTLKTEDAAGARKLAGPEVRVHEFMNFVHSNFVTDVVATMRTGLGAMSPEHAQDALLHWAGVLRERGLAVVRSKLETEPWTPGPALYLETHLHVWGRLGLSPRPLGLLRSVDAQSFQTVLTLRTYSHNLYEHTRLLKEKLAAFQSSGLVLSGKVETEKCVFDDNQEHDKDWEDNSCTCSTRGTSARRFPRASTTCSGKAELRTAALARCWWPPDQ